MTAVTTARNGKIVSEAGRRGNVSRPLTHSLDLTKEGLAMQATRASCSIPDCPKPLHFKNGLCQSHERYRRLYGDPNKRGRAIVTTCSAEGCERRGNRKGLCSLHDQRAKRHGDPYTVIRGPLHPRYAGEDVGYRTAHKRLFATLGPASAHACVDCRGAAAEWSYKGGAPDERTEASPTGAALAYSLDPDFYVPRCVRCHRRGDYRMRKSA